MSAVETTRHGPGAFTRAVTEIVHAFNTNKTSWVGLVIFLAICVLALLAPVIAPYDPIKQHIADALQPPSQKYWLGTDAFGRDVWSRILWGGRISLLVSVASISIAMVIGSTLGIVAGYKGGWIDQIIMRAMDVLLSFPTLVMGLLVVAVLGANLTNLIIAIALTVIPKFARIARAPTVAVKELDYVEACRALGYSDTRIMAVHILPNVIGEVLVLASLWTATAVRIEAYLSFIGLGVKPPTPTWGGMIRQGFEYILDAPWMCIYTGLAVLVLVFSLNLLGDGLRDAVDPKLRNE
ncbi:MAG: ABC transporter permease [Hyphomicrobiaceae bacterium]|nr:ABC transporter permease [Hyphomicrobiaceae bacterium]